MARIAGVDLPKEKRVDIALAYIYGVGRPLAAKIIAETQIDPATRVKNLTEGEVNKISTYICSFRINSSTNSGKECNR